MRILIGIQARMTSKRLPGKVLKKVNGIPIIEYLLKRVGFLSENQKVYVLTSKEKSDDPIVNYCQKKKINFFRGSLNNVHLRYTSFLEKYSGDAVVRISADSPMLDYKLVESMISLFQVSDYDILTNIFPRSFPSGQSVEIIRFQALNKIKKIISLTEREHVTKFFYNNHKNFKIYNIVCPYKHKNLKLSIDDLNDFNNFAKLIRRVGESFFHLSIKEIITKWEK